MRRDATGRGFTLIEMAVVIAIAGVVAALAVISLERAKPRSRFATTATELHALLRNARLNALQTGNATIVLFFPEYANRQDGVGRVVVLEDAAGTFFTAGAVPNFSGYDPATDTGNDEILATLDFPRGVVLALGPGAPASFDPPFERIAVSECGFCSTGVEPRGAIRFDARGRATFHSALGGPLDLWGASLALSMRATRTAPPTIDGVRLFVVNAGTGGVKSFIRG